MQKLGREKPGTTQMGAITQQGPGARCKRESKPFRELYEGRAGSVQVVSSY